VAWFEASRFPVVVTDFFLVQRAVPARPVRVSARTAPPVAIPRPAPLNENRYHYMNSNGSQSPVRHMWSLRITLLNDNSLRLMDELRLFNYRFEPMKANKKRAASFDTARFNFPLFYIK
jgi:hypothetical protein